MRGELYCHQHLACGLLIHEKNESFEEGAEREEPGKKSVKLRCLWADNFIYSFSHATFYFHCCCYSPPTREENTFVNYRAVPPGHRKPQKDGTATMSLWRNLSRIVVFGLSSIVSRRQIHLHVPPIKPR